MSLQQRQPPTCSPPHTVVTVAEIRPPGQSVSLQGQSYRPSVASMGTVLIMSMVVMVVALFHFYCDDRLHPGMETAHARVRADAEAFALDTVTGRDMRGDIGRTCCQSRQSSRPVEPIHSSAPKVLRNLGTRMALPAPRRA